MCLFTFANPIGTDWISICKQLMEKNYCFNEFSLLLLSRCFCIIHNLIIIKYENFHLFNILHEFYMIMYFLRSSTPEKPIPIIWFDLFRSFIKFWYLLEHNSEKNTSHISTYSPNITINVLKQKKHLGTFFSDDCGQKMSWQFSRIILNSKIITWNEKGKAKN